MIIIRGYSGGYSLVNGIYSGKLAGIILAYPVFPRYENIRVNVSASELGR